MNVLNSARGFAGLCCVVLTTWAAGTTVQAQSPLAASAPQQLNPFITTATRTATAAASLGSVVDVISGAELVQRQISTLAQALGGVAGAPHFANGARGSASSLFLRGANSNQTLFLVDGLRLNDPNTDYALFLGGACVSACDRLEIAHGPQSTLYGGEAVGGVVSLRALRGAGATTGTASFEAGSFGTVQGGFAIQGERGANAYNFSVQGGHTDNDRANNYFDSANTTLRLDRKMSERLAMGGTVRWFHGVYGDPGDHHTNDPDNESREENLLVTTFADITFTDQWRGHAILGGQDRRFVAESPRAGRATAFTVVKNRRAILDAHTTFSGVERHRVTAGVTAEGNHTRNTGFGDINRKQGLVAVFVQDEYSPIDTVFLTAGLRSDDFDTFGRATTGRATAAWLVAQRALKLRASYGTAFRSPSFLDLYGQSAFYTGNPDLRPEKARGWDAGLDYYLAGNRGVLSATWFETNYRNLIAGTADFRSVQNILHAETRGAELSAQLTFPGAIAVRASYTYLEAENLTAGTRLLRRPRHGFSAEAWRDLGRGLTAGAAVIVTAQREDVDARTFGVIDGEDYTVARLYAAYRVTTRLTVKARFENLLNERYEEVNGYPALGFGGFLGVEWTF